MLNMYSIYSVHFDSATDTIKMSVVDPKNNDKIDYTVYDSPDELPEWVQRKLAVLQVVGEKGNVENVGWNLNEETAWVYKVEDT